MAEVIKKDGTKQPFDIEKVKKSVAAAADQANIEEEKKNEAIERVSTAVSQLAEGKEEITTIEIKERILSELDSVEPRVSESWRKYEAEKGA